MEFKKYFEIMTDGLDKETFIATYGQREWQKLIERYKRFYEMDKSWMEFKEL